jgi:hypothetical protein
MVTVTVVARGIDVVVRASMAGGKQKGARFMASRSDVE